MEEPTDYGTATLEEKKKWIEALESGDYIQTDGTLKGRDDSGVVKFCCLGVYCDVAGTPVKTEAWRGCHWGGEGSTKHYIMTTKHLGDFQDLGIEMNDRGDSFMDIAQAAREFYEIEKGDE